MKRSISILLVVIILIIGVIAVISYLKGNNNNIDEETARCIASKSQLYVKTGCSHCLQQEQILGNYLSLFNITDCLNNIEICSDKMIEFIPAWIINNQKYYGVKSLKELKDLAGC